MSFRVWKLTTADGEEFTVAEGVGLLTNDNWVEYEMEAYELRFGDRLVSLHGAWAIEIEARQTLSADEMLTMSFVSGVINGPQFR